MMEAELAVVASSAATTIVGLMATDAWGQVKEKITALWWRFRPEQAEAVEAELSCARSEMADADKTVTLAISREWESRLLRLLAADASAAGELRRVVAELRQIPSVRQVQGEVRQHAKASGHSTVIQIGGDGAFSDLPLIRQQPGRGETDDRRGR
jgi:hypothetical protein